MWLDATEHNGMTIQTVSTNTSYGGVQGVYRHASQATGTLTTAPLRKTS